MAKEPTVNNATVNPIPNGGYSFTPQSQTPIYNFAGMDWGYNPETGDLQRVYTNNGTGSPYGDPQYMSGTPAYGSPNPTMSNTSPYTGGVSASNPFPSHMTQYNYSGNAPFTFNEQWYLQQNPDVAAAVKSGMFPSGQAHYQQFGMNEGRQMNSNTPTADPNSIPYSTTNPYEVNPYLNFDVNRAYAVPAPIMNGTWNNLTLPTNIWKPTSYVNQVDQARETAARQGLYNPATPTIDTAPPPGPDTSLNAMPTHGNTSGWQRSDTDATLAPVASMADAPSAYMSGVMPRAGSGRLPRGWEIAMRQRGMGAPGQWVLPGDASNYSLGGGIARNNYGLGGNRSIARNTGGKLPKSNIKNNRLGQEVLDSLNNYTAVGDIYGASALGGRGASSGIDTRYGGSDVQQIGMMGVPTNLFDMLATSPYSRR